MLKYRSCLLNAALLFSSGLGCSHADDREIAERTAPYEVVWSDAASAEEAAEVSVVVGDAWDGLTKLLGPERVPKRQVIVRLLGDAKDGAVPTVDPKSGDILLVKYPGDDGGYTASLTHEMVHAFRWELWTDPTRQTDAFLFVEEGFAEAAAVQVSHPSTGFPTFGFPIAVAAGAWLGDRADKDVIELINRHKELNFKCMAQAYTLRLSFISFLVERFGFELLLQLAYFPQPLTAETIGSVYGSSLPSLTNDWATWARAKRDSVPDVDAKIAEYLTSPIQYLPHCDTISSKD